MTIPDTAKAREYLARAEHAINTGFSDMATPLATIATAYAVLASTPFPTTVQIRPIKVDPTELAQSIRAAQAVEEARPHDEVPAEDVPCGDANPDCGLNGGSARCGGCDRG